MESGDREKNNEAGDLKENDEVEIEMEKRISDTEKEPLNDSSKSQSIEGITKKKLSTYIVIPINLAAEFASQNKNVIKHVVYGLLIVAYCGYFIAAMFHGLQQAIPLVILTVVILVIILYELHNAQLKKFLRGILPDKDLVDSHRPLLRKVSLIVSAICITAFIIWLLVSIIMSNPKQLISLIGLGLIILFCFVFSKYPNDISWRPVLWGIGLQFILGLLVLRTTAGFQCVKFIGDQVATFMRYSDYGASFVFDENYGMHLFAFKILPMIVFFSTVMNMLYYVGIMQWFIGKLAWLTQISLGTSAIESIVAAANIFVGMTEAPLVVRPYLADLTNAEIHSVLTCGLGSIAFSVFGAFVEFGVDSVHLLTACVMSAPASLAISRLLYPERKKSKFTTTGSLAVTGGTERNIVEAAAAGASMSIGLVANIAANLIAFLALLAFINAALGWFGSFVGHPELSFELLCGYLFMPLAFLMGADWEDCGKVGELFGMKTFLNEFIAYKSMKPLIANRIAGDVPKYVNGTIQYMSMRSEVVAIHALCGFCNISSLGIIIGGLGVLMPSKKDELAKLAVRALIGGIFTCCMTASIASLLFTDELLSPSGSNFTESAFTTAPTLLNTTFA